ncbi:MAG: hypothetical protein R2741_11070 [Methanolobus sp.]
MKQTRLRTKSFLLFLIVILVSSSCGCLRDFTEEPNMAITDIEMSAESVKTNYAWFNITSYIENMGGDSSANQTLMIKVFNKQTDLLELKQEAYIGVVKEDETKVITQTIRLPKKGTYRIELEILRDGEAIYDRRITLSGIDSLPTDLQETGIQIDGIDFIVKGVNEGSVTLGNDIYLKNDGAQTTDDYRILVKAREMDARLIADKEWINSGEIDPEETIIRSVELTVPDNYNYVVEVSVWKDNVVVRTGEDYVQLNPEVVIDRDEQVQNKNIDTNDFVVENDEWAYDEVTEETVYAEEEAPGFTAILVAISLITALLVVRRRFQ